MAAFVETSGFADPVLEGQAYFRCIMNALARPGTIETLEPCHAPPLPLTPGLAGLALALADHEAPLWLDRTLDASEAVAAYLRFHTGARIVADPLLAAFALVADFAAMPPLADFAIGSDEYPDRSTTIILAVDDLHADGALSLRGPGIDGSTRLGVSPWRRGFTDELAQNRSLFPRGVDLVLVAPTAMAALPRTTIVQEA